MIELIVVLVDAIVAVTRGSGVSGNPDVVERFSLPLVDHDSSLYISQYTNTPLQPQSGSRSRVEQTVSVCH